MILSKKMAQNEGRHLFNYFYISSKCHKYVDGYFLFYYFVLPLHYDK